MWSLGEAISYKIPLTTISYDLKMALQKRSKRVVNLNKHQTISCVVTYTYFPYFDLTIIKFCAV